MRTVGHAGTLTWSDSPRNWRRISASSSVVSLNGVGGRGRLRESRLRDPLRRPCLWSDELDVAYHSSSTLMDWDDPEGEGVGERRRDESVEGDREVLRDPLEEGGEDDGDRRPFFLVFLSSRDLREERPRELLESRRSFLVRDLDWDLLRDAL